MARHHQRNRARAAIHVAQALVARQLGEIQRRLVQHFRLRRIDLKKRRRADFKAQAAQLVRQRVTAVECAEAPTHDDVRALAVFVQDDADRPRRFQGRGQFRLVRNFTAVDDQHRHRLALSIDADDNVPHQPRVRLLNVRFDAEALHPPQYTAADFVRRRHGVRALRNRDNIVAARREKACHGFFHRSANGQRRLIAVVRWICHPQHWRHVNVDMPDAAEAVLHLLAFRFQRRFVGHMAPHAAAAAGVCRTIRHFPGGRRRQRLSLHAPKRESGLHFDDAHPRRLTGQHPRHKNSHAVRAAHAFQVRPKAIRRQGQQIVLLHPLRPLPVLASIITGSPDFDKALALPFPSSQSTHIVLDFYCCRGFRLCGGEEGALRSPPPPLRSAHPCFLTCTVTSNPNRIFFR